MNFNDWSEEISKNLKQAQEQYWKNMAELHAKISGSAPPETPNMTEGLERLWSLISPQMPKQADDMMKQVFGMGKGRDQFADNFTAWKDVVDSLVESQLHSFGIPTKKAQEELVNQVEALTLENETLKTRIKELEAELAKQDKAASKKSSTGTGSKTKKISTPASVKKMPKSKAKAKPLSKAKTTKAPSSTTDTAPPKKAAKTTPKTTPKTTAKKPVTKKPASTKKSTAKAKPDDLSQVKGIGPVIQKKLIAAGITSFAQLAALSPDQAQKLDEQLNLQGRVIRENWVSQAAKLATGDAT